MGRVPDSSPGWTPLKRGLLALGAVLVILGALVGKLWDSQLQAKFYEEMALSETSRGSSEWLSPSVNITSKIYLWNWTNAEEIGTPGYKPIVEEVGPYVFREKHVKVNVTWNRNGTVTYRNSRYSFFVPELSSGSLSDNITSVNTVAATLSAMSVEWNFFARRALSLALVASKQKVYWTHTVGELTFQGFDNPIVKLGNYMSPSTKPKFGYFYEMNGTASTDLHNMATGSLDIFTIGEAVWINYENMTKAHDGNCSKIEGGLGELWPPGRNNESEFKMYYPDMCRSISYYYDGESTHNGIDTLVFASVPETVDNGTIDEKNSCFCHRSGCVPSGVFDLRSCREEAPVFMSYPHLYLADPVYHEALVGLAPDPEKHKFYMKIEPRTGVPLEVAARLQLNVKITRNSGLTMFRALQDVLVPVFWIETLVSLPETHTSNVKMFLTIVKMGPYACAAFVTIGFLLLAVIIFKIYCRRSNKKFEASPISLKRVMTVLDDSKSSDQTRVGVKYAFEDKNEK